MTTTVDLETFAQDMKEVHSAINELCDAAEEFGDVELEEAMNALRWQAEQVKRLLAKVTD